MSKVKIFLFLQFLFFFSLPVLAQVDTGWVRRYNGPADTSDYASALAVDTAGNLYVTGRSWGSGTNVDYATIKYNSNGDTLWVRRYNGPADTSDYARALAIDNAGNVYVTGYSFGSGSYNDYATIKYAPNGDTLWVRRYNGPGNGDDEARALAVDDSGNVYVTGSSAQSSIYPYNYDYSTIKYTPNGDTLWVRRYNSPGNNFDWAFALAIDGSGNVYVTGNRGTIKYSANGDSVWFGQYGGFDLAIDESDNVYATDTVAITKYAPNGDTLWRRTYGLKYDRVSTLKVDGAGNVLVFITGVWGALYCGDCCVVDFFVLKYNPFGDTLWVRHRLDGRSYSGSALALDDNGNVYITGTTYRSDAFCYDYNYFTIKYAPNGDTLWVRRYNGPSDSRDVATSLAVDDSGNVYVTGYSWGSGTGYDYATIKYNKFGCAARAGDVNSDYNVDLSDIMLQINYLFKAGAKPDPFCSGDANANGNILLTDVVYLINYIFKSGLAPVKSNECCL